MLPEDLNRFGEMSDVIMKGSLAPVGVPLTYKPFTPDLRGSKLYSGYGGQEDVNGSAPLPEAVRVAVRVRPLIEREKEDGKTCVQCMESTIMVADDRKFYFDHVFGPETSQATIYSACTLPLLRGFVAGFNATVLAYGQTGSGKTFTMGTDAQCLAHDHFDLIGILPRLVTDLYSSLEKEKTADVDFSVRCQFLEIYQEEIRDLLNPSTPSKQIAIREADGRMIVSGAAEVEAEDYKSMMTFFFAGCSARTTGATLMNMRSSRSHAVFTIILRKLVREPTGVEAVTVSKLHLVDLAGSERNKKTGAQGLRFKESVNINKGLLALGNVITALGDPTKRGSHVPYRQSRITRLLQDSLGGNSQTLMIACCSPADSNKEETLNTLKYANRARNIKNKPAKLMGLSMDEITALQQALIAEVHTTLKLGSPASDPQVIIEKLNGESLWRVMVQLAYGLQQAAGSIPPPPGDEILRAAKLLTEGPEPPAPAPAPPSNDNNNATPASDAEPDVIKSGNNEHATIASAEHPQPKLKAMADSLSALRGEHAKLVECIRETSAALETINHGLRARPTRKKDMDKLVTNASASLAAVVANLDMLVSLVSGDDSDTDALSDAAGGDENDEDAEQDEEWSGTVSSHPSGGSTGRLRSPRGSKGAVLSPFGFGRSRSLPPLAPLQPMTEEEETFNKWKQTAQPAAAASAPGQPKSKGRMKKAWGGVKHMCSSIKKSMLRTNVERPAALVKVSTKGASSSQSHDAPAQPQTYDPSAGNDGSPVAASTSLSATELRASPAAATHPPTSPSKSHKTFRDSLRIWGRQHAHHESADAGLSPRLAEADSRACADTASASQQQPHTPPTSSTPPNSPPVSTPPPNTPSSPPSHPSPRTVTPSVGPSSQTATPALGTPQSSSYMELRVSQTSEDWPTQEEIESMALEDVDADADSEQVDEKQGGLQNYSVAGSVSLSGYTRRSPPPESSTPTNKDSPTARDATTASNSGRVHHGTLSMSTSAATQPRSLAVPYVVGPAVASLLYGGDASRGDAWPPPQGGAQSAGDWLRANGEVVEEIANGPDWLRQPHPELTSTQGPAKASAPTPAKSAGSLTAKDNKKGGIRRPWS